MATEIFKLFGSVFVDTEQANKSLHKTESTAAKLGNALLSGVKTAAKFGAAVLAGATAAATGLVALTESTREYRTEQAKLQTAFEAASFSADAAQSTYSSLNAVLGDSGQAVEASAHLAQLCSTEQELSDWTTIATGLYATFGDSLPIEGLTEAANETAKVGSVTGALADALNWVGLSEDEFNAQLAKCSTEQERAALITETLNGAYSETAEMYRELNGDALAANEAQDKLAASTAKLGGMVEPLVTKGKQLVADVLISAMPYVESFANQVLPVLMVLLQQVGTDVLPLVFDLLSGLMPSVSSLVQELLPMICELVVQIMPLLIELCNSVLPVIVDIVSILLPPLLTLIEAILPPVTQLLNILMPILSFIAEAIAHDLANALYTISDIITAVSDAFADAWTFVSDAWVAVPEFFSSIWQGIQDAFGAVADWFENIFSSAWNAVKNVFSAGGEVFSGIKEGIEDTFVTVVNAIISGINTVVAIPFNAINGVLNKVRSIEIVGYKPFHDLWDKDPLAVPQIPQLYEGGVLEKGQTGYLEGTGAEAVVPLHNNRKWISAVADDMRSRLGAEESSWLKGRLDRVILLLEQLLHMGIYLDGKRVGELLDNYLGNEAVRAERLVI